MISHPDDFSRGSNCSLTFDSMIPFCFKAHYSVFCSILILQNIFIKIVILLIYRPNRKAGNDSKSQSHVIRYKWPSLYYWRITVKKHPGKLYRVLDNLLSLELMLWGYGTPSMQLALFQYRPIKNSVIRIKLSPLSEHSRFDNTEDW